MPWRMAPDRQIAAEEIDLADVRGASRRRGELRVEIEAPGPERRVPELGLVCITASEEVRFRALTRTRLAKLSPAEQRGVLEALYKENLRRLALACAFCERHAIRLYRCTSGLFPFADTRDGEVVLSGLADEMRSIGQRFAGAGIRMVLHPDQYVVLQSEAPKKVENSLRVLAMHAMVFDMLGQPRSRWASINLHGGGRGRLEALIAGVGRLPWAVRSRLTLENDEYSYGAAEILEVCRSTGTPMVFDAHHHACKEGLDSYHHSSFARVVAAARQTWKPREDWQMVHISNGRTAFRDRQHSDFISDIPESFAQVPWIEVEAKGKEEAIFGLRRGWLAALGERSGCNAENVRE